MPCLPFDLLAGAGPRSGASAISAALSVTRALRCRTRLCWIHRRVIGHGARVPRTVGGTRGVAVAAPESRCRDREAKKQGALKRHDRAPEASRRFRRSDRTHRTLGRGRSRRYCESYATASGIRLGACPAARRALGRIERRSRRNAGAPRRKRPCTAVTQCRAVSSAFTPPRTYMYSFPCRRPRAPLACSAASVVEPAAWEMGSYAPRAAASCDHGARAIPAVRLPWPVRTEARGLLDASRGA